MTDKIGSELEKLVVRNEGVSTPKTGSLSETDELKKLQLEIAFAIQKSEEVSAAGEAAVSDAYLKLEAFATNKLPLLIRTNVEAIAEAELNSALDKILLPLKEDVGRVVLEIDFCQAKLRALSWNWRLFFGPVAAGLITLMIGSVLVYFLALGGMRKYAEFGRQVNTYASSLSPKAQEKFIQDVRAAQPRPEPKKWWWPSWLD